MMLKSVQILSLLMFVGAMTCGAEQKSTGDVALASSAAPAEQSYEKVILALAELCG